MQAHTSTTKRNETSSYICNVQTRFLFHRRTDNFAIIKIQLKSSVCSKGGARAFVVIEFQWEITCNDQFQQHLWLIFYYLNQHIHLVFTIAIKFIFIDIVFDGYRPEICSSFFILFITQFFCSFTLSILLLSKGKILHFFHELFCCCTICLQYEYECNVVSVNKMSMD